MKRKFSFPKKGIHGSSSIKDVDSEIRNLVKALNRGGFSTWSSCSGHPWGTESEDSEGFLEGYISFSCDFPSGSRLHKLKSILKKAGLNSYRLDPPQGGIVVREGPNWDLSFRSLDPYYSSRPMDEIFELEGK